MNHEPTREVLSGFARAATSWAGSGVTSVLAVLAVIGWVVAGIPWGFSLEWHLWGSTLAGLLTVVMVFVIQHTTNHESRAMLVKLDELIRAHEGARGEIMSVEHSDLSTLDRVDSEMRDHPHSAPNTR
jgi:low affinity Fe/Cu permease